MSEDRQGPEAILPVLEERLVVGKREVEAEHVRVHLVTETEDVVARLALRAERLEIERVPVGREVAATPEIREEDGVTVIPVLEEVMVVEKRLFLKEELRIRRVTETETFEQPVTLRRQRADLDQSAAPSAGAASTQPPDMVPATTQGEAKS